MKIALYVGNHQKDPLFTRISWLFIRLVQRAPFAVVTHVEAIHQEHEDGTVTIASSSLRDGGVRAKRTALTAGHWLIYDVPSWDVQKSTALFKTSTNQQYDLRGALATVLLWLGESDTRWFCNEWVGAPFLQASSSFKPAQFAAIVASFGTDVTGAFFRRRAQAPSA
jgi:hypothetical protein